MKTKLFHPALLSGLFCCLIFQAALGQVQLGGLVMEKNQQPLPGASVLLLTASDSSLVQGRISESDGSYRYENITTGQYLLKITILGYEDYLSEPIIIEGSEGNKTLPLVTLTESAQLIDELERTLQSIEEKRPNDPT